MRDNVLNHFSLQLSPIVFRKGSRLTWVGRLWLHRPYGVTYGKKRMARNCAMELLWLSGRLVGTNYFYYFCTMELFKQLASLMLPSQILDYFDVVKVEEGATQVEISLDETYPEPYKADENIESKGFMEPTTITDFPIRDHKLLLHVRRRRWLNRKDGVSFCRPLNLVAEGTCYSKEFAAFLKDTYGEFPSDLPYA